ncbi:unnamed protein product [Pleuronectes platessa]|uniref:Uncharacterized protein n=1 Tax=Pleuronectes platessa TaxID=8262 RepID=A0A9N7YE57_PLEPL|nr:unnamed protein product [Pleuronectes platessa]
MWTYVTASALPRPSPDSLELLLLNPTWSRERWGSSGATPRRWLVKVPGQKSRRQFVIRAPTRRHRSGKEDRGRRRKVGEETGEGEAREPTLAQRRRGDLCGIGDRIRGERMTSEKSAAAVVPHLRPAHRGSGPRAAREESLSAGFTRPGGSDTSVCSLPPGEGEVSQDRRVVRGDSSCCCLRVECGRFGAAQRARPADPVWYRRAAA